jgi:hypothetical protein
VEDAIEVLAVLEEREEEFVKDGGFYEGGQILGNEQFWSLLFVGVHFL